MYNTALVNDRMICIIKIIKNVQRKNLKLHKKNTHFLLDNINQVFQMVRIAGAKDLYIFSNNNKYYARCIHKYVTTNGFPP